MKLQCTLKLLCVIGVFAGMPNGAHAITTIAPPSSWGASGVIALVGRITATGYPTELKPYVLYKNRQTGACSFATLPYGAYNPYGYPLADHTRILGTDGADIISIANGGSVTCNGLTWTLSINGMSGVHLGNAGYFLQGKGLGGDDYLYTWFGSINWLYGDDGSDKLLSTNESAAISGGIGNDFLRASNNLFIGKSRYLDGGSEDDCLESNNNYYQPPNKAYLYCGSGYDRTADAFGIVYQPVEDYFQQEKSDCETTTTNHCVCMPETRPCAVNGNCCSGVCTSGQCTVFF